MQALPDDQPWVFDLVSPDDAVRAAALARHDAVRERAHVLRRKANSVWNTSGYAAAAHAVDREYQHTLTGLISAFCRTGEPAIRDRYAAYAALYLRWEERFLPELRAAWDCSPWTTKEVVLRAFIRGGVPAELRDEVADLIVAALRRPYRCKDWMFAGLLRHVRPVERITELDDDRARFAEHVLRHPELTITRLTYPRWRAAQPAR